jgi:hypothetical protein
MLLDCSFQAIEKSIWSGRSHFGEPHPIKAELSILLKEELLTLRLHNAYFLCQRVFLIDFVRPKE